VFVLPHNKMNKFPDHNHFHSGSWHVTAATIIHIYTYQSIQSWVCVLPVSASASHVLLLLLGAVPMRHCRRPAMHGCVMAPGLLLGRAREEEDRGTSSPLCSNSNIINEIIIWSSSWPSCSVRINVSTANLPKAMLL
jgi:hypothetical protein